MTLTKQCGLCRATKDASEFYESPRTKSGLRSWCKACCNCRNNRDHALNPQRQNRAGRKHYNTPFGRAKALIRGAHANSAKRGHPSPDLTWEDVLPALERGICAVTGLRFAWGNSEMWEKHPLAPSLDRPDNSLPYSRSNFRVVCWAVNVGCATWGLRKTLAIWARALGVSNIPEDGMFPNTVVPLKETPA